MASLAAVKSYVTLGPIMQIAVDFSPCTVDTPMLTVSSCGVKRQYVLSVLKRKAEILDIHMHFCGFSLIHSFNTIFFHLRVSLSGVLLPYGQKITSGL